MKDGLDEFLASWPYEGGRPNVRIVLLDGGVRVVQVRLELGALQMHLDGRPDGQRPHGAETLLEWHESRLEEHRKRFGTDQGFGLTSEECDALRAEGVQVYQRYSALFALDEHSLVTRDTERNLRLFDFCQNYALSHGDRSALEPYRPFVLMMRGRAQASLAMQEGRAADALAALDTALLQIKAHYERAGAPGAMDHSNEVAMLRSMRNALVPRLPMGERAELEARLAAAVAAENYRLAAILRDELRALDDRPKA